MLLILSSSPFSSLTLLTNFVGVFVNRFFLNSTVFLTSHTFVKRSMVLLKYLDRLSSPILSFQGPDNRKYRNFYFVFYQYIFILLTCQDNLVPRLPGGSPTISHTPLSLLQSFSLYRSSFIATSCLLRLLSGSCYRLETILSLNLLSVLSLP